jgi:methyl-accepting chemotaxis protein
MTAAKKSSPAPAAKSGLMGNLKIRSKILIGFGAIVTILVVVSATGFVSFLGVGSNFESYEKSVGVAELAAQIDREFLDARRHVREFGLTGSKEDAKVAEEELANAHEELARAIAESTTEKMRAGFTEMTTLTEEYDAGFKKVIVLHDEFEKLIGETLNPLGLKSADELKKMQQTAVAAGNSNAAILAGAALQQLMEMRLNVNKSLAQEGEAALESAHKAEASAAELEKALAGLVKAAAGSEIAIAAETLAKDAIAYHEAFGRIEKIEEELNQLLNVEMKGIATKFAEDAGKIKEEGNEIEHALRSEVSSTIALAETTMIALSLAGLVIGGVLAMLIAQKGIVGPIRQIVGSLQSLSEGDLTVEIHGTERADEVGDISKTAQVFKDNLLEAERLRNAQAAEQQKQIERGKKMEEIIAQFDKVIGEVVGSVASASNELQSTAQSMSATAEETSRQSNAVAGASEEMTQNVQTVASATEELSASIREIGNQVTESTRIVGGAVTQANETNAKVKALSEAAQKIGDVVTLINEIASQTNLLALNATIEAARAGDAGKGFAVVASEVKNLASQTAKATEEIAGQVKAIQESTDSSAQAIQGITETINRVSEISTMIASAVEQQGAATQEISKNVQQAAAGTTEVSSNISGVTQASQQTSTGATQVLSAASELAKNGDRLKREVDGFLHSVRAL